MESSLSYVNSTHTQKSLITIVCRTFSPSKMVFYEKKQTPSFAHTQSWVLLCILSTSSHRILTRRVLNGKHLVKTMLITTSSRAFLGKNGIFYCVWQWKAMSTPVVWCHCLDLCTSCLHQQFEPPLSCNISTNINTVQRINNILIPSWK